MALRSEAGLPEHGEDQEIDSHEEDRVRERPRNAEQRAAVLRLDVPAEEVPEQLAVADQIAVYRRHRRRLV
jgi:hypothetical protein